MSNEKRQAADHNEQKARSEKQKKRGKRGRPRPRFRSKGQLPIRNLSFEDLRRYFIACGRCGYFLTGYRVLHGLATLEKATDALENGWLSLQWDNETRQLVQKSYGIRTDISLYHFEIACPECQRRLVFDQAEGPPEFRVRVL